MDWPRAGRDYDGGELSDALCATCTCPLPGGGGSWRRHIDARLPGPERYPGHRQPPSAHDVLRGEWGFKGFVVSDWGSVQELIPHGVAEDDAQAAAMRAAGRRGYGHGVGGVSEHAGGQPPAGRVTGDEIDEAARRVLRVKHLAGLFQNPFHRPGPRRA